MILWMVQAWGGPAFKVCSALVPIGVADNPCQAAEYTTLSLYRTVAQAQYAVPKFEESDWGMVSKLRQLEEVEEAEEKREARIRARLQALHDAMPEKPAASSDD